MPNVAKNIPTTVLVIWLLFGYHVTDAQPPATVQQIDQYIQSKLTSSSIPGLAIAVVYHDTLLFSKGYGTTDSGKPVTANTPFAIASLSKAFTAMAIMQLVESKQIDLDDPV